MNAHRLLADAVVLAHAAYAAFVVVGLAVILLGLALRWRWVRNFWFRIIHFAMIGLVAMEAILGVKCPLTVLEDSLRAQGGQSVDEASFIARLARDLLFYEAPEWVFSVLHCLFAAAVLLTLVLAPPRWPWQKDALPCPAADRSRAIGPSTPGHHPTPPPSA